MCAIVGVASRAPVKHRGWLAAGRDAMSHRGPDDAGEWWSADGRAGLGHRRLSIIDLSAAGHQPMHDASGELTIVFNGEIYNFLELREDLAARGHTFRSKTDTEVVMAAYREWGVECLSRLNGMFALALYDGRRGQLFLARDRAGEKPLFYAAADGALRFASELKGLLADPAVPRRVDREALDCYLAMGYVPGERCMVEGVRKLPPAHALTFDVTNGVSRVWRYWSVPALDPGPPASEDALAAELETLVEDSVRRRLVADVPVGVLLSGGVDSSLVTAMAVRAAPHVKTFTVRFPAYGAYDETAHARLVARHFGTDHVELEAGESSVELLPMLARQFDEPMADSSMVPTYLVSRLVREHCTVALGGDGGDELFGGYVHYSRFVALERRLGRVPRAIRAPFAHAARALLPVGFKGREWLQGLDVRWSSAIPLIPMHFDTSIRGRLTAAGAGGAVAERIRGEATPLAADVVQRATRLDFQQYLAEDILVKVDRASMLCSLEMRAPLLDHRIIEFAFGRVPSSMKATAAGRKLLLRRLAERVLPPQFDSVRKQGFSIPLPAWLRAGPWQAFFRDVLLDAGQTFFSRDVAAALLEGQAKGRTNSERLFALVMFELWRREYGVAV